MNTDLFRSLSYTEQLTNPDTSGSVLQFKFLVL